MEKKYFYLMAVALAVIILTAAMFIQRGEGPDMTNNFPSPTPEPTATPSASVKPKLTPRPSAGIIVKENSHDYLALKLDNDGNRRLVLNNDCSELIPSQVAYKNNVEIMLDNSYSENPHTLKIGDKDFVLAAGEWRMERLLTMVTPASLKIFCGSMELGQIDLN